jgi:hypothetical protein
MNNKSRGLKIISKADRWSQNNNQLAAADKRCCSLLKGRGRIAKIGVNAARIIHVFFDNRLISNFIYSALIHHWGSPCRNAALLQQIYIGANASRIWI